MIKLMIDDKEKVTKLHTGASVSIISKTEYLKISNT